MPPPAPEPEIVRLRAADFCDLNRHLSAAFGRDDFAGHLPSLYTPTEASMSRVLAVRERGRIVATTAIFNLPWRLGDASLRLAGIGGVSVDAACSGRGWMRWLMDAAVAEIDRGRFHAAWLDGARGRYGHWGFEKGGAEAALRVSANSLAHRGGDASGGEDPPRLTPLRPRETDAVLALAGSRPVRVDRDAASLATILRNRHHETGVLRDAAGTPIAYACFDRATHTVHELAAADRWALDRLVAAVRGALGGSVTFRLPLLHTPAFHRLRELAEDAAVEEVGNWRIHEWPAVLGAALRLKHAVEDLPPGSVLLRIADASLRLSVGPHGARCEACDDAPAAEWSAAEAVRRLTGPLREPLPAVTAPLAAWCPLPIGLPLQDRV